MLEIFNHLGQFFHQDIFLIYPDVTAATSAFMSRLDENQAQELVNFIQNELKKKSDSELEDIWEQTGSDIFVSNGKMRDFLMLILEQLKTGHS